MSPVDRSADRRQAFAARVRRTPGYLAVKDGVLPRLRGNTTLTDLVWRVFTPAHGLGVARRTFRADGLPGPDTDRLPVIAFTVLGADGPGLLRALDGLVELRERTRAFRGVVVLDRPDLAAVRERGFVADHVIAQPDWYGAPEEYDAYVGRRLVSVVQGFRVWHLVHLAADGTLTAADERLLRALPAALEAGVERPDLPASTGERP